jgi:hypothetical protein
MHAINNGNLFSVKIGTKMKAEAEVYFTVPLGGPIRNYEYKQFRICTEW